MGFERNDVVFKNRLNEALNEENNMGFEHNDIVTVDAMNKAIAEGGGGGDYTVVNATVTGDGGTMALNVYSDDDGNYPGFLQVGDAFNYFVQADSGESVNCKVVFLGDSIVLYPGTVTASTGDAVYDSDAGTLTVTGDFTVTGYMD